MAHRFKSFFASAKTFLVFGSGNRSLSMPANPVARPSPNRERSARRCGATGFARLANGFVNDLSLAAD